MRKQGELTTQQMVMLIIVIASFAILLFFLVRLNLGEESKKEICRNSVVLSGRSGLPTGSLSCYRSYKCITTDGNCKGLTDPEIVKVKTENETYEALAKEMTDCWWMFGEGRINYVGTGGLTRNNYCSICSQILLDPSLSKIKEFETQISKDKLYDYLAANKMPNKEITYLEYFFGNDNLAQIKQKSSDETGAGNFGSISIGKQFFVVMGITSEIGGTYKWIGGAVGTLAVVSLFIPGVNLVTSVLALGIGAAISVGGETVAEKIEPKILALTVKGKGIENQFMSPTIIEINSEEFKALNCEETLTLS